MTKRDYYEILGLGREAGDLEIKQAYRKLAMKFHPDRNPDNPSAEESFKECSEAYSILSDGQKRAAYDRFGHAGLQGAGGNGGFNPEAFTDFSDILGDLFGFPRRLRRVSAPQLRAQRGEDVRYDLEIDFTDAMFGMTAEMQFPRMEPCGRGNSTGAEPGSTATSCPTCHGRGEVLYQQSFLSIRRTCGTCNGTGQVIRNPCSECRGNGFRQAQRKLKINIPAGVDTGTRVRLTGEGHPGFHGGPAGDLYVFLKVKEHPFFERQEHDLHCTIPINIAQAALGCEIEIPTLGESSKLKIPEGTQSGAKFRFRNKGVAVLNSSSRGDLFVHVEVKTPAKLSREQKKLLEQLRDTLPVDNAPAEKGLFEKVKDYFM